MTGETHVLESPPTGAAADWTIPQDWAHYTQEDHRTWDTLFARQARLLPGRASDASLRGLDVLKLSKPGIPDFEELSERLMKLTGWQVVARSEEQTSELQSLISNSYAGFYLQKHKRHRKQH